MNAEPRPDSFAGLASSLVDDRAIVDAIDLAVAGLAAEIDCEAQAAGIRELLDILGARLDGRCDTVERWAAAQRSTAAAV